jgi:hypothetical protein
MSRYQATVATNGITQSGDIFSDGCLKQIEAQLPGMPVTLMFQGESIARVTSAKLEGGKITVEIDGDESTLDNYCSTCYAVPSGMFQDIVVGGQSNALRTIRSLRLSSLGLCLFPDDKNLSPLEKIGD